MSTIRDIVAARIKSDSPTWSVNAYLAGDPDNLAAGKVFIAIWRTDVAVAPGALTHTLNIDLMHGGSGSEKGETTLDAALDDLMLSLQRLDGVTVTSATRSTYGEGGKFNGWQIECTAQTENVYRAAVQQERNNN